ncbi:MAG: AAA family ATPase, partial [Caldilinea sp.]
MPVLAVLSAKLRPPAVLPGWIDRRALLERLAAGRTHRLTLITAPAGYGKSTLAAQFVRGQELPGTLQVVWLTLDAEDDDPAQFLTCLTAALAPLMPALAALIASSLNQNRLQAALQSLLFGMEQMALPLLVVLDDFHHLRSPAVQQLVAAAVERSPAACRWMVLTRHVPPARLIGKLRVQGELLEVNTDELRLSSAEIEALAVRFKATQLDADALDLLDGSSSLLAEYLTAEVLTQLPDALCLFLLQCSILDRLHWELCNAITAQEASAALLEQARAEQLFIRALDAEGEWYELHQLFRDLLQRQLRLQCTPAQIQALHCRAADWFLARNEIAQALHYLVVGGIPELAAALLVNHARPALLRNQQAELRRWLNLLPNRVLAAHPQLLLDRAWLGVMSATDEFVAALADAEAALAGISNLPAVWGDELAVLWLWRRMFSDDSRGIYSDALQTAERLAPESVLARGWCWMAAVLARSTQPAGAPIAEHAAAAAAAFAAAGYEIGTLVVIGWQAEYYAKLGDAQAALAACVQAHQIIDAQQYPAFEEREFFDMLAGEVHYWSDHPEAAAACFQRVLVDARMRGDALPILRARVCLQLCEMASGKTATMTDAQREEETALWRRNVQAYASGYRSQVAFWQIHRWVRLSRPLDGWD